MFSESPQGVGVQSLRSLAHRAVGRASLAGNTLWEPLSQRQKPHQAVRPAELKKPKDFLENHRVSAGHKDTPEDASTPVILLFDQDKPRLMETIPEVQDVRQQGPVLALIQCNRPQGLSLLMSCLVLQHL